MINFVSDYNKINIANINFHFNSYFTDLKFSTICDRICENHPFGHTNFAHRFCFQRLKLPLNSFSIIKINLMMNLLLNVLAVCSYLES